MLKPMHKHLFARFCQGHWKETRLFNDVSFLVRDLLQIHFLCFFYNHVIEWPRDTCQQRSLWLERDPECLGLSLRTQVVRRRGGRRGRLWQDCQRILIKLQEGQRVSHLNLGSGRVYGCVCVSLWKLQLLGQFSLAPLSSLGSLVLTFISSFWIFPLVTSMWCKFSPWKTLQARDWNAGGIPRDQ